jgi:transcriptional antiterminator
MSQNVAKLRQKERLAYIEANLIFKTQEEIAEDLQVSRKTIERDLDKWKRRGGMRRFLIKEFFELYGKEKLENTSKALDRIVTLLTKEMVREDEAEKQAPKVVVKIVDPDTPNTI